MSRKSKRGLLTVAATLALALLTSKAALADKTTAKDTKSKALTVAVYGDSPYGTTPTDTSEMDATPAFIAAINADPQVKLVFHVGDIHSGKQYCTEAYDRTIYSLWTAFKDPLIYTPGDNEWTDCHKAGEGGGTYNKTTGQIDYVRDAQGNLVDYAGGDPIANLDLIRSIFFANPGYSLGQIQKQVLSQAQFHRRAYPSDGKYVENVLWIQSKVLFVTINLPGGSNNDTDVWYGAPAATDAQKNETKERTEADIRWLNTAFNQAKVNGVKAVVILAQADMWDPEKGADHQAGYEPIVRSIALNTQEFKKPVLMFNGDSHVYRSDNPLSPTATCTWELANPCTSVAYIHPDYDVPNFHRIVVHGSTTPLEWLKLTIDPQAHNGDSPTAFGPFSWERVQPKL